MVLRAVALVGAVALVAGAALADDDVPPVVGGHTYAQHLIEGIKARHPEIRAILVEGQRDGMKGEYVLGATAARQSVFHPVSNAKAAMGGKLLADGSAYVVRTPYFSSTDHRIGTLIVTFAHKKDAPTARLDVIARTVAADMARVTLSAKNAGDPYPYDPAYGPNSYAQTLTERTIKSHPELLVVMLHATPPGKDKNVIIGSNIGRFGKLADDDDLRVIDKGETNLEIAGDHDRFETEVPLNDASGTRIGALGLVFKSDGHTDKEVMRQRGLAIRDEIARAIPNSAALFGPAA